MSKQPNNRKHFTDEEILDALRSNEERRLFEVLHYLWEDATLFKSVKKVVGAVGRDVDNEARSILNESLAEFDHQVKNGIFDPLRGAAIRTYLVEIAKKKAYTDWRSENRQLKRIDKALTSDPDNPLLQDQFFDPEQELIRKEKETAMETALTGIGKSCREVLKLWIMKYSFKEIAHETKLTVNTLKDKIPDCRKRLHQYLLKHPELLKIIRGK